MGGCEQIVGVAAGFGKFGEPGRKRRVRIVQSADQDAVFRGDCKPGAGLRNHVDKSSRVGQYGVGTIAKRRHGGAGTDRRVHPRDDFDAVAREEIGGRRAGETARRIAPRRAPEQPVFEIADVFDGGRIDDEGAQRCDMCCHTGRHVKPVGGFQRPGGFLERRIGAHDGVVGKMGKPCLLAAHRDRPGKIIGRHHRQDRAECSQDTGDDDYARSFQAGLARDRCVVPFHAACGRKTVDEPAPCGSQISSKADVPSSRWFPPAGGSRLRIILN
ncbi:hypothetical protein D9M72_472530 [compost metagenome]